MTKFDASGLRPRVDSAEIMRRMCLEWSKDDARATEHLDSDFIKIEEDLELLPDFPVRFSLEAMCLSPGPDAASSPHVPGTPAQWGADLNSGKLRGGARRRSSASLFADFAHNAVTPLTQSLAGDWLWAAGSTPGCPSAAPAQGVPRASATLIEPPARHDAPETAVHPDPPPLFDPAAGHPPAQGLLGDDPPPAWRAVVGAVEDRMRSTPAPGTPRRKFPSVRGTRGTLALVLAGSGHSANGVRARDKEPLEALCLPPELLAAGLDLGTPRELVVTALTAWMAEPLSDTELEEIGFAHLAQLRRDPSRPRLDAAAAKVTGLFVRTNGGTTGYVPNPALRRLGLRTGRHWPGLCLTPAAREYLESHFEPNTGRQRRPATAGRREITFL